MVVNGPSNSVVYFVSSSLAWTSLGTIPLGLNPVVFSDNGLVIVVVDGTATSYAIDMVPKTFGTISSTNFHGGTGVTYLDTYFIFNRPGTAQFSISLSNVTYAMLIAGTGFDALDIAAKTGSADNIVTVASIHGELWLIGELTTEVWANSGAADFTFQRIPGAFVDHGCAAAYSLSQMDVSLFWLVKDRQGRAVIVKTEGYAVVRISTHAIEQDIQSYDTIDDAIGYCHQIDGHAFYVLTFPNANKTWAYELATGQWHERASIDGNGNLVRHRGNCFSSAYDMGLVGDYQNGALYTYDQDRAGRSFCNEGCQSARPPILAPAGSKPMGDWTVIRRDNGLLQWAYRGSPVYSMFHDAPNAPRGDGEGGVWHLLPIEK
jgi:hypothetical protein